MKKSIYMLSSILFYFETALCQNVGVGTTNPLFKLSVKTTGNGYGMVNDNGEIFVGTYVGADNNGFKSGWLGTYSNHPLTFFTNNGFAQVTLLQNGHLGIGTVAPEAPLDVYRKASGLGTALFRGTTYGTVFNYSTTEDTYIRGGKAGSKVIINDAALGNVGIGTDAPADKLTVRTASNSYGLTHTDGVVTAGTYIGGDAGWLGTKSNHPLYFFTNNGLSQMTLHTDGKVSVNGGKSLFSDAALIVHGNGIALNSATDEWRLLPSTRLFVSRNGALKAEVTEDGDWNSLSDFSLKENIKPYKTVLQDIKKLHVSTYRYKSNAPDSKSFGLIAQNVNEYFPEIVSEIQNKEGNKLLAIAYAKTGVLALKAIQEQQEMIDELKQKIEHLEKLVSELASKKQNL
jgi:hypothetical protein